MEEVGSFCASLVPCLTLLSELQKEEEDLMPPREVEHRAPMVSLAPKALGRSMLDKEVSKGDEML